ncbi:hypothetical protein QZH41_009418 [Actinostola sp. cb2023]|nr:hypothetical protein QZH41_009418 [Actinostola sp. cb2023]
MTAVVQAGMDLTKMRDEFADQQNNLEANLKKARVMSTLIQDKIKTAVKRIADILAIATKEAYAEMEKVTKASDELGDLEKSVGTKKVQDKAKEIRTNITKGQPMDSNIQKDVINENGVIATLDAAKILAKEKVIQKQKLIEEKKAAVRSDITKLENDMASAENRMNKEQQLELEDEMEARSKIQQAVEHNSAALSRAKEFLFSVEEGIKKFHEDIKGIPLTR